MQNGHVWPALVGEEQKAHENPAWPGILDIQTKQIFEGVVSSSKTSQPRQRLGNIRSAMLALMLVMCIKIIKIVLYLKDT